MSKRRLTNLLKRKVLLKMKKTGLFKEKKRDSWAEKEIRDFSRLGGNLVVMSMGS